MPRRPFPLKFSVAEICALLLIGGVGFAALRTGGMLASAALVVAMLLFIATSIAAIVAEEKLQRFAIGFIVAGGIYGALALYFGPSELTPEEGSLPTTQALKPLRDAMTTFTYANLLTGETLTHEEALAAQAGSISADRPLVLSNPTRQPLVLGATSTPTAEEFMSVAHVLIGMALGYAGGKFAQAIARRERPTVAASS